MKQGWAIWITGLPASGKSSITRELVKKLEDEGNHAQVLESDTLRKILTPYPSYSLDERNTFYNSMVYIGELLISNGVNVIFDATANRRKWRDHARDRITHFIEVYVDTPLEVCRRRDPKGIYEAADKGDATYVPGQQQPYERPKDPELIVDGTRPPQENTSKILEIMKKYGFI